MRRINLLLWPSIQHLDYIDDVLSINNDQFHLYVDSIYPSELEIKDTKESFTSALYLDVLFDADRKLTQLYDKQDDFNFASVNFPYTSSNIPLPPVYRVYISQLIRYSRLLYILSVFESGYTTDRQAS
jgi:hypothetical protein